MNILIFQIIIVGIIIMKVNIILIIAYHNHLNKIVGMKKPYFWYSINIIKNELNTFKKKCYNLIANNSPKNDTNKSKYDNIINIINYNNVQFNNLRLRYENNIIDFNEPIYLDDDSGVDLNLCSIYIQYWVDKTKLLS